MFTPMLRTEDLDYDLPDDLIATRPADPRDSARLLVLSRSDPSMLEHRTVRDLPGYLRRGDVMVVNRSAVTPARIAGERADSGGRVEGLFLKELAPGSWEVLLKSNGKLRADQRVTLRNAAGEPTRWSLVLEDRAGEGWRVRVERDAGVGDGAVAGGDGGGNGRGDGGGNGGGDGGGAPVILDEVGATPLPPYILARRRETRETGDPIADALDRAWYQTVYADRDRAGSVAAPTAGLHFTPELLAAIDEQGVERASVVLHVGMGTFKPVTADRLDEHDIHKEWIEVSPEAAATAERARAAGGRVLAVGTTSVRALESVPRPLPESVREGGLVRETDLYILPGFAFRWTDALLTNFHLPRSTLVAMVGAFLGPGEAGVARLLDAYRAAVAERYRFYSYGDAMLILP